MGGSGTPSLTPSTLLAGSFTYYVSETVNGCEGPRAALQVQINAAPALGADRQAGICSGGFYNLATLFAGSGAPVNFVLNGAPVGRPDSLTVSGLYEVIADGGNGCTDTARVNLQVQPPVVAFAGNDTIAVLGQPFQLSASGGGLRGSYRWTDLGPSFTAQFSDLFTANPTVILRDPVDSLRVDVTDEWGCRGSAVIRLTVLAGPAFYVPTAFSPNGDGLNDIFRAIPVGFGKLRYFRVFNRFGELVFETSRYLDGWDGMYKGKAQQPGNYVWVLQAEGRGGGVVERKGTVVLVR
jgi:gliding motility-associated-like protein